MPLIQLPLGIQSNPGRFPAAGTARLVNCYVENAGKDAKVATPRYAISGLTSFATLAGAAGGVRAMLATPTWLYVVAGRLLFRVDASGTASVIGGIPTDGTVTMARNRADPVQIGIVSDGVYWVVENATLTERPDADLPASCSIAVLDGYFLLPGYGNQWFVTGIDDAMSVDPLDFGSAESQPDAIVRIAVRESEAVLFGAESTEWWQDVGGETFPFARVAAMSVGCLAPGSVARVERTLAWVANDKTVRLMNGYQGHRVSTHAVERFIADEPSPENLTATSWTEDGHIFYALSGSTGTWVYDVATGYWHERRSYGKARWRVAHVVEFAGKRIAGDYETGTLYEMDRDALDEAGQPIVCEIDTPLMHDSPGRVRLDALHLDVIAGQGLVPGDDTTRDPQIMIALSRDGGATWGSERMLAMGVRGDRTRRIVARRWGVVPHTGGSFKITASASVARGFLGAAVEAVRLWA